jgi:hypothetical protein
MLRGEPTVGRRTLYHATSLDVAKQIVRTRTFFPSTSGMLGPGIYLAETLQAAKAKCHHHGAVLELDVDLGTLFVVNTARSQLTKEEAVNNRSDSVKGIGYRTGSEYVVYDSWRIQNMGIVHVWVGDGGSLSFRRSVPDQQNSAMRIDSDFSGSSSILGSNGGKWCFSAMCL